MVLSWNKPLTAGDPKFWPASVRYLILANLSFFVFLGNAYSSGIATGFEALAMEFEIEDFSILTGLISWSVFALGISNLFWMPTAMCFGKRPVMIFSMLIFLGGTIWSIEAPTIDSLLGSRVVASFGAGSIESLGPSIIADIFFEKYFATANAVFALSLSAGTQFGPLIAGYLIQARGWRWYFILIAILLTVNILTVCLFLPETTFRRVLFAGETAAETDKEALEMTEHIEKNNLDPVDTNAQPDGIVRNHYAGSYLKDLVSFRGRSYEPPNPFAWIKQFSLPFRFLFVPAVLFAAISYGIMLAG